MAMATLMAEHIGSLRAGEIGFHAQLYPGVYPPDAKRHHAALGNNGDLSELAANPFWDTVRSITDSDGKLQRLMVLPTIGSGRFVEPGGDVRSYTEADLTLMLATARVAADAGEDVRVTPFHQVEQQIAMLSRQSEQFGSLAHGIDTGDPKASFWSFRGADEQHPHAVALMDYHDGQLPHATVYEASDEPGQGRIPLPLAYYELYWRDVYTNMAAPVCHARPRDFALPTSTPAVVATRSAHEMPTATTDARVAGRRSR